METIRNDSKSSFEFGKASNRFKIYFWEVSELLERIKQLREAGLLQEDD